ncbi:hypothetical protein BLNAU_5264 [Blattamonas nauphoetae]|uniref:Right handed beta helix domain-containing protein n=1 Tax=Blattamonas nauphoetae TaxID=2049346 RepID=A0ABQ9Y7P9_9EUKA|nr:hypothetical protein BLNAU_5264 [Blattamonas nauphoetae]
MTYSVLVLLECVASCLNSPISPTRLSYVLNTKSLFSNSIQNDHFAISLPEGTYVGDNVDITHRWMELTGETSTESDVSKTVLIACPKPEVTSKTDDRSRQDLGSCMFCLTNSTLSLKWINFSLIDNSEEGKPQKNEGRSPRLAIVSGSMLTVSESLIGLLPWTSPILISSSTIEESTTESSFVVQKCSISNDVGEMRGIVETSSFPSIGGSVSVSIVGCSFDSQAVLGNDGIGLSLTRKADQSGDEVERLSSSLIGCSFVNMSSIGSSHLPHISHLNQKMLGCVVSLTSSHLSGSTIRNVNTGGSVLCSNSSFSSLLPSPNPDADSTQGTVTLPGESTPEPFEDDKLYSFTSTSGTEESTALFSNYRFSGEKYPSDRPLTFSKYTGTISILSCSFSNFASADDDGVVLVHVTDQIDHLCFKVELSNFTSCSAPTAGGALVIEVVDDCLINSCRFEDCSSHDDPSFGGCIFLAGLFSESHNRGKKVDLVDCVIADCSAFEEGGGVFIRKQLGLSIVNTKFEHCDLLSESGYAFGGGVSVNGDAALSVEGSQFIECSSRHFGSAIFHWNAGKLDISDTLVQNCASGTTGAVCIVPTGKSVHHSFLRVYFDGNTVGSDTMCFSSFFRLTKNTTKFPDVAIMCTDIAVIPTVSFDDCFTTIHPDSSGMIKRGDQLESNLYDPVRHFDVEFAKIGPFLTGAPTVRLNKKTGRIELEVKGKTPPISQEYEVTVEDSTGTETNFKMFSNGTGTLVSGSEANLTFKTGYTITKIVGVVPTSSSSTTTNAIAVPAAAWAFNISLTPAFLTFTTPKSPPSLVSVTCVLLSDDPKCARVIVVLNEKVKGSFDIVVLEEGKEVTITVRMLGDTVSGESSKFVVVGKDRELTHDTTYTIKSIVATSETDSPFVLMKEKITFRIPKSPSEENKGKMPPETKKLLSWLIPLVACVLVALIVAIVVVRRRHQTKGSETEKEMEGKEALDESNEREVGVDCSDGVIGADGRDDPSLNSEDDNKV